MWFPGMSTLRSASPGFREDDAALHLWELSLAPPQLVSSQPACVTERVSRAAAIPHRPHPVSSSLPFFPSHQTVWCTATRGTLVDGVLHHGKFYWTHSPRPKLGTVGFLGQLRNGPAPQKAQPPICQTLIKALPGRGML